MSSTMPQVVDGSFIERTERVVEADPFPPTPQQPRPKPNRPKMSQPGPAGHWGLGVGIPFVVATVTASLLGAWSPSAPTPSGTDSAITTLLQLTWAAGIVVGAVLLRSFWALVAVPLAAVAGTYLGMALAMVIFTATQFGLAAGFDPSRWPQGDPDGWFLVLVVVVPVSFVLATISVVISRLAAAEVRWHREQQHRRTGTV